MDDSVGAAFLAAFPDWERGTATNDETRTLDRMRRLLDLLGSPDGAYPFVHVVGTKGKGSTATTMASALQAAGYRVGLFTSPHLLDARERIQIDGAPIATLEQDAIVVERLRPTVELLRETGEKIPLHFEVEIALALEHFRRRQVDVAVVEAGMGGRLDATNTVRATALTVVTTIGLDHVAVLGNTIAAIAAEKAAVIRQGGTVVSAPQSAEAMDEIERVRVERDATLTLVGRDYQVDDIEQQRGKTTFTLRGPGARVRRLTIGLAGGYQAVNGAVAVAALDALKPSFPRLDDDTVTAGLAKVRLPGRLQEVSRAPLIVLDGAHNGPSSLALATAWPAVYPESRPVLVLAVFADKDLATMLPPLLGLAGQVIATTVAHPRALPTAALAARARALRPGQEQSIEEADSVVAALTRARALAGAQGTILVTGSFRTVGDALAVLSQEHAAEEQAEAHD